MIKTSIPKKVRRIKRPTAFLPQLPVNNNYSTEFKEYLEEITENCKESIASITSNLSLLTKTKDKENVSLYKENIEIELKDIRDMFILLRKKLIKEQSKTKE